MLSRATVLGSFPLDDFRQEYWQKSPLFVPGALPGFSSTLGPDELAGLACEEHVESRIVTDTRSVDLRGVAVARPYRLLHGPFEVGQFSDLGDEAWTLLVQDVDKLVPKVHALLDLVSFLPRWSVDDIMISYAVPGGSVGPHTDRYDVFLLQAQGTRRWQISRNVDETRLRTDTELRVLAEFKAEEEFIARPGDVLYLPPGVAHYGVALDECMTYSFGFRAPTEAAIVSCFADEMVALAGEQQLVDTLPFASSVGAELSPALLSKGREFVAKRFEEAMLHDRSLGRYLTTPKPHLAPFSPDERVSAETLVALGKRSLCMRRGIRSRFLYIEEEGAVVLFVDGQDFLLGSGVSARRFAQRLCEDNPIVAGEQVFDGRELEVLAELVNSGALVEC